MIRDNITYDCRTHVFLTNHNVLLSLHCIHFDPNCSIHFLCDLVSVLFVVMSNFPLTEFYLKHLFQAAMKNTANILQKLSIFYKNLLGALSIIFIGFVSLASVLHLFHNDFLGSFPYSSFAITLSVPKSSFSSITSSVFYSSLLYQSLLQSSTLLSFP